MNSVSFPWIASARVASSTLVALLLVASGCDDGGGTASDTDATTTVDTTDGTTGGTGGMTEPTTTDGTGETDAPTTTAGVELSHAADIQPIWDANCTTGCHVAMGTGATWFLITPESAYDSLIEKNSVSFPALVLVTPGSRDKSYLWHKIKGTQFDAGGGGTQMPQPPAMPLSDADMEKIGLWIDQGAKP